MKDLTRETAAYVSGNAEPSGFTAFLGVRLLRVAYSLLHGQQYQALNDHLPDVPDVESRDDADQRLPDPL